MATYIRTIKDPNKPCIKIIRVEKDEVIVHYDNLGDAACLLFLFSHTNVRHQCRRMSQAEVDRAWAEQGQYNLGAGI